ncbi:OpgC family protein [Rhizobium sp. NRK18]|uniref:OpgC family protein n=1 Tax=Rhizobium sp. NRK18 TaxID=2964667 RepID=UPI0021C49AC7|nr:OpgC domain-containing protein [Rhizobium sp. NRK18]MCQ2002391.1 OpgC domain-containing protein [Rhizobium sp. NRK18]
MLSYANTRGLPGGAGASAAKPAQRDTRLDVIRALALITIFINHVPGQMFEHWTSKNFGFSDASEAFVLISGIAIGLAYGRKYTVGNRLSMSMKAVRRAFVLYGAHIACTFTTLAVFALGAWWFHQPDMLEKIAIGPALAEPVKGVMAILTLGHQFGYNNILPLYAALLLMVPGILWLESQSPRLLVMLSIALWFLVGLYQIAPGNMLMDGVWFFNPLSWQLLFVIGIVSMRHVQRGGTIYWNPFLFVAAAGYVILSAFWVTLSWWNIDISFGLLPKVLAGFEKTYLSLPRLLHVLALAYLVVKIPFLSAAARRPVNNPLSVLGRHSLGIFVSGTILAMIAQVLMMGMGESAAMGISLILLGIVIQFGIAYWLDDRDQKKRKQVTAKPQRAKPMLPATPIQAAE